MALSFVGLKPFLLTVFKGLLWKGLGLRKIKYCQGCHMVPYQGLVCFYFISMTSRLSSLHRPSDYLQMIASCIGPFSLVQTE